MIEREKIVGTHYAGSEEEVRALNAFIKLTRATESLNAAMNSLLSDAGLTVSQFGTLEVLYHLGPLCQSQIGDKILKSGGNMTLVIDNLEKRGLVRRERDAHDRRQITVHLTEAGRHLIADYLPQHVAVITELLGALSPQEQEQLGALCKTLGLHLRSVAG